MQRGVNLRALTADALEICLQAVAEDLVDLTVVERRVQTAGKPLGPAARTARGVGGPRPQSMLDARRRKTHRTRKLRIEQQELRDPFRPQVRRVDPAIR